MMPSGALRTVHVDTERAWSGGQRQVAWLAAGLVRRGHPAWLLARPGTGFASRLDGSGVTVLPLEPRVEWDPFAIARIRTVAREAGADLLVAHAGHAAALVSLAALAGGRPFVVTRRVAHPIGTSPLSRMKHGRASLVIAVSDRVRCALAESGLPAGRVRVIHSGVDIDRPARPAGPQELAALGLDPAAPLAVMVSALVRPHKDPLTFLRALAEARRACPRLQGLLVGGGPLLDPARRECGALGLDGHVVVAGHRDDAERLLAAGSVAVLSSRDEGLGTTLLDAMLWGVPVAATAAGGVPEVVRAGLDGLLSPPGDAVALGRNIAGILSDDGLRARLVVSGRERVREFSVERMVDATIEAYRHALYSARC